MSSIYCNFNDELSEERKEEVSKEIDSFSGVYDVRRRHHGYEGQFDLWVYIARHPWIKVETVDEVACEIRKMQEINAASLKICLDF